MKIKSIITLTVVTAAVAALTGCSNSNKTVTMPDATATNTVATMATNAAAATGSMVTNAVDAAASAVTNGAAH